VVFAALAAEVELQPVALLAAHELAAQRGLGRNHEHRIAGGLVFRAAGTRADKVTILAATLQADEGAEADRIAGREVTDRKDGKLGDGLGRLFGGLGLAVREVRGLEAA